MAGTLLAVAGLSAVSVTAAPVAQAAQLGSRVLRSGSSGADVKRLQRSLHKIGYTITPDGQYGAGTKRAVAAFQQLVGLKVSGTVGPHTVSALAKALSKGTKITAAVPAVPKTGTGGSTTGGVSDTPLASATEGDDTPVTNATIGHDGLAVAPSGAPVEIQQIIAAGNVIAKTPYIYGGGHGSWKDDGYDCSGSVSYALHGAGLLNTQLTSGDLEDWGKAGKGKWVTIYANAGHTYMYVAGLRFDTSGASPSRWQRDVRDNSGFVVRHPAGL